MVLDAFFLARAFYPLLMYNNWIFSYNKVYSELFSPTYPTTRTFDVDLWSSQWASLHLCSFIINVIDLPKIDCLIWRKNKCWVISWTSSSETSSGKNLARKRNCTDAPKHHQIKIHVTIMIKVRISYFRPLIKKF